VALLIFGTATVTLAEPAATSFLGRKGTTQLSAVGWSSIDHSVTFTTSPDTALGAFSDTSSRSEVAGAKSVAFMFKVNDSAGASPDQHTLTVTPRISVDGSNWTSLTTTYSLAGSAGGPDGAGSVYTRSINFDNGVALGDTISGAFSAGDWDLVASARYIDFIVSKTDMAGPDTAFVTAKVLRTY